MSPRQIIEVQTTDADLPIVPTKVIQVAALGKNQSCRAQCGGFLDANGARCSLTHHKDQYMSTKTRQETGICQIMCGIKARVKDVRHD